jgi:hypothetical protein
MLWDKRRVVGTSTPYKPTTKAKIRTISVNNVHSRAQELLTLHGFPLVISGGIWRSESGILPLLVPWAMFIDHVWNPVLFNGSDEYSTRLARAGREPSRASSSSGRLMP